MIRFFARPEWNQKDDDAPRLLRRASSELRVAALERLSCPHYPSLYCSRSERHGWRDFLGRLFGLFPWHCRICSKIFYRRERSLGMMIVIRAREHPEKDGVRSPLP